jgi:hypothetical protein
MLGDEDYINRYNKGSGFDGQYNSGDWGAHNHGWSDGTGSAQTDDAIVKTIGFIIIIVLAFIALPALIVALVVYMVFFRLMRFRPTFIATLNAILSIIGIAWFNDKGGFKPAIDLIRGLKFTDKNAIMASLSTLPSGIMSSLTPLCLIIGPWLAFIFVIMQCARMRNSPHLVLNEGLSPKWMYHFRFRMSPVEIIMKRIMISKIRQDKLHPYHRKDLIPLGVEEEPLNPPEDPMKIKNEVLVCRAEDEAPKHTMVTGAAGSGKTVTLKSMMTRDIDNHKTIFVIDCKKDPEVAEFLSRRSRESGCNFYHFSADLPYRIQGNPEGPSSYDPLSSGSTSKDVDMMLNTREWDTAASVYRDQAQSFLSKVFAVMDAAKKYGVLDKVPALDSSQGKMWTFTQMLDKSIFNAVVVAMNQIPDAAYIRQQASELNDLLSSSRRSPDVQAAQHSQGEYLSKMTGLMVSSYGKWMKGGEGAGSGKIINISDLSSESGNVVLFSLDAAQKNDLGSLIGSMICGDLANMTETRKNLGQDNPIGVYIDEFQSLPPECVKSMLQKARSADVGLTLAFQSLDQVSSETGSDAYVKSLLDTCSNFIFHAGSNYDTGLLASKIIGTHIVNKYIVNRRNETSLGAFNWNNNRDLQVNTSQDDDWIVNPSEFAKLSMPNAQNKYKSEAIIIKKASSDPIDKGTVGAVAHKTRMIPPECVLTEYFDPKSDPINIDEPLSIRLSRGLARDLMAISKTSGSTVNTAPGQVPGNGQPSRIDDSTRGDHETFVTNRDIRNPRESPGNDSKKSVSNRSMESRPMRPTLNGMSTGVNEHPITRSSRRRSLQDSSRNESTSTRSNQDGNSLPLPFDEPDESDNQPQNESSTVNRRPTEFRSRRSSQSPMTPKDPVRRAHDDRPHMGHGFSFDDFDDAR